MTQVVLEDRGRIVGARLEKLAALRERGIEPYAYSYSPTHSTVEALALFTDGAQVGPTVSVAGRLVTRRAMGKTVFAPIADRSGRIQLYFRRDVLGDDAFELLDLADLGDWIGARGELFRTSAGEISIRVDEWQMLSKAVRPLPLGKEEIDSKTGERRVYSGFTDREARYRQRYADLAVHPEVRAVFVTRARIIQAIRRFLDERGFLEVETPVLQPLYGGASARPFVTHHNTLDMPLYLRIADELYLKRLIVGGLERVYEIGKDFRNEGMDRFHNPEFTMLEFYAAYMDYREVMGLTEEMLQHIVGSVLPGRAVRFGAETIRFDVPFARYTLYEALREIGGVDAASLSGEQLGARARQEGVPDTASMGRGS